jgi:hypothetical protein
MSHHDESDQENMRGLLARTDHIGMDQQTLAHLLKAICTMGGVVPGEIPTTGTAAISAEEDVDLRALGRGWRPSKCFTPTRATATTRMSLPKGPTRPTMS